MADSSTSSFPWASIAVLIALVSSTLLVPTAFERLRPPEKERAQPAAELELEVDARLWEDPFVAARRREAERVERCSPSKSSDAPLRECDRARIDAQRDPALLMKRLDEIRDADGRSSSDAKWDDTLVIAALVPGNPFVGAEESRRRTRYAML